MAKEEKDDQKEAEPQIVMERPADGKTQDAVDRMILDSGVNKYDLIILARRWAYELKSREGETRAVQDLIPESIKEILTSKVNSKTIRELPTLRFLAKKQKNPTTAIFDNIGKDFENSEKEAKPKKK